MRVGVLLAGDTVLRAAHSLAAHPDVDEVVVIGPATSNSFRVVRDAAECDLLIGTGKTAPGRARDLGVRLIWDGETPEEGVAVYGASPQGLALAVAARESDPQLVAVAHPNLSDGRHQKVRFPDPVGVAGVVDGMYSKRRVALGRSANQFAAVLTRGVARRVAIVDDAAFMSGIALAAGWAVAEPVATVPVWDDALTYLKATTAMGLVMAEG